MLQGLMLERGVLVLAVLTLTGFTAPEQQRNISRSSQELSQMTCSQLWYLGEKIRADGGVCPRSERARQAFFRTRTCVSQDERVLGEEVGAYLAALRGIAADKGCPDRP
ncbi:YARHG domain-containing protein [Microvirga tunisiensis]|uniref:YARHG domain-containing protein n=2 Tax=Pannonibacter tanglangensis TaxID=2750084 RepID=A0A7X5J8L3_9HYPH|nr:MULTISPECIES: YARHG domain-containing protein [unclassified Pannonibacter]NBN63723.1 YARHG domain-containing protein [Pannonibacter sp. XCT-34]NBN77370.1 YARHG domain-containing protein [Pannonibacter sp. XCT-53]